MTDDASRELRETCQRARALVHERVDRPLNEEDLAWLAPHLSTCPDCAAFSREIERVHDTLAQLPEVPFPDAALEEVWARTVYVEPWWKSWGAPRPVLAAAAAIALATVVLWVTLDGLHVFDSDRPSEQAVAQALVETRYALALASNAVQRSEQAFIEGVLRDELAPALERVPMRWPPAKTSRRNGT